MEWVIDLETCNLYIIHNSFQKALDSFGCDVDFFFIHV